MAPTVELVGFNGLRPRFWSLDAPSNFDSEFDPEFDPEFFHSRSLFSSQSFSLFRRFGLFAFSFQVLPCLPPSLHLDLSPSSIPLIFPSINVSNTGPDAAHSDIDRSIFVP